MPHSRHLVAPLIGAAALLAALVVAPSSADAKSSTIIPAVPARTAVERTIAAAVLAELNSERALHQLPPLRANSDLMLSARRHDVMMARDNTMSHQLPHEPVFSTRISQAGYTWHWVGENIAWNSVMTTFGVVVLERMMYNEKPPNDEHRLNILNTHYRDVGVDVLFDHVHHRVWLTTDFGRH